MKTKTLLLFTLCLILLGSCKKDSIVTTTTEGQPPAPKITIESTIRGLVLDRQGFPLENATVHWGSQQTETNEDGIFTIDDLVNGEEAVLKVSKDGYFDAFQTILPISETILKTKIQLTQRLVIATFDAGQGGQLQLPNGSGVSFAANAFTDDQGNAYNGQVNVYATYIDPTDPDLEEIMPGNLQALTTEGESRTLQSFGMINVELEGESGESLQISSPAQLTMPVPMALLSQAPQSLPLWHFDENSGLWMEEGSADLVGNNYLGNVTHFTFWNCDVPYDLVELSGTFRADKFEVAGLVRVRADALNRQGSMNLSSDGSFRGKVIKGTSLILELIDPNCDDVIYTADLGSLSDDLDLGIINLELNDEWVTLTGNLVNCDNNAITDGIAVIRIDNQAQLISPQPDGSLAGAFRSCNASSFTVLGIDWTDQVRGNEESFAVSPTVNVGNVEACGTAFTSEMRIRIPGQADYVLNNCTATQQPSDSLSFYQLMSTDNTQGAAGKVIYKFNFVNWTNDPMNPVWGMSFERQVIDAPGIIFQFAGDHEITVLQYGDEPGEAVIFQVNGVRLINEVTGEETENCVLELSAVLE
ncbi:MAG: hypothetical protein KTR30_21395 [Saprospiraceae bacterium]|nr:hypothetical protein [Saprospiraceae bacterium]